LNSSASLPSSCGHWWSIKSLFNVVYHHKITFIQDCMITPPGHDDLG